MEEGPRVPVPDTGSAAHNEAFNETLGSPAQLPLVRCLLGTAGTAGSMHAGCSISAPKGLHIPPAGLSDPGEEVEHRHRFLGTGNKSDRVPGCPENPRGVTI